MMIQRAAKLWRLLCYFWSARKVWRRPRHSEVLIYDRVGEKFLAEYLSEWKPEILHVRGEQICVPVVLASLFRPGNKANAYLDCYLACVQPRLVVTYVDNDIRFYSLALRNKNLRTMFVHNGPRGSEMFKEFEQYLANGRGTLKVDVMLTVGARYIDLYRKYVEGSVLPMGSLRNNLAPKREHTRPGTIAFISQFRNTEGFFWQGKYRAREDFFEKPDRIVLSFLLDYAQRHGRQLVIIPCPGDDPSYVWENEKSYYSRLMNHDFSFTPKTWHGSSYDATDAAEVVVGIDSALGYESVARGNKTAIFSFRSQTELLPDRRFGWPLDYPDEGSFWTNAPDPHAFERILDHLFALDERQWQDEVAAVGYERLLAYDPGNGILQSALKRELGTSLTSGTTQ
jgi:surface carbohydrate biosynthesis protein